MVIGADVNGHVGEGNRGHEEEIGGFGIQDRNAEGQMVVDCKNDGNGLSEYLFFHPEEAGTQGDFKSGSRSTQAGYILCRQCDLKEICDCKVVVGQP